MTKKTRSFTILELLIAISVSGIVVTGMIQTVRNVQKMLSRSRTILQINKSVCLFFNQIERDFNSAIVPILAVPEKKAPGTPEEKPSETPEKTPSEEEKKPSEEEKKASEKEDKTKKKEEPSLFVGVSDEDETKRIKDKKYSFFIRASFVNTNPLQIWGQRRTRLVRVGYELVKNKTLSTKTKSIFDLYRKETTDLKNEEFKEKEGVQQPTVTTHLVAANIKEMFVEYSMPKPKKNNEEAEPLSLFSWGKTKETKNIVPQQVEIRITFWGEKDNEEKTYTCLVPIFSYPTEKEKPEAPEKKPAVKPGEKKEAVAPEGEKKEAATPEGKKKEAAAPESVLQQLGQQAPPASLPEGGE